MLNFFMVAHKAACETLSKAFLKTMKIGAGNIPHSGVVGWRSALWCSFLLWSLPNVPLWSSPIVASICSVWSSAWLCSDNTTQHTYFIFIFIENTNLSRKVKPVLTIWKCRFGKTETPVSEPIYIPRALSTETCINHLQWRAGSPILFCRPTQEPMLAQLSREKSGRG